MQSLENDQTDRLDHDQVFLLALMDHKYFCWSTYHFNRDVCTCLKSIIPGLELM